MLCFWTLSDCYKNKVSRLLMHKIYQYNILLSVLKVKRKSVHQSNITLTDIQLARSVARANRVKSEAESAS